MKPGEVVAQRFEIERLAGAGGMGAVYRARDRVSGAAVALKMLHQPDSEADRFEREAAVLADLEHPGIVRYVAHGTTADGRPWLAIEWLEGLDLAKRLQAGKLAVGEGVALVRRVAEALGAAHARGVLHRDVKPSNVFLCGGSAAHAKVLDFGIARLGGQSAATRTGVVMGTPGYMAPEQARGKRDLDARADVFALGAVLFECLAGRPAFAGAHVMAVLAKVLLEEAPRLAERCPDAPEALDDLVARMLSKDREGRPRDGAAVAAELAALSELAEGRAASAPVSSTGLGAGEKRLVSVVLAGLPGASRTTDALADTLGSNQPDPGPPGPADLTVARDRIRLELDRFEARVEALADGSLVATLATLATSDGAGDQAARAARFALAAHALLPDMPMALATGRGWIEGEGLPVGDAIDRAAALLGGAAVAGPVRIDVATAGLLDERFEVGGDAQGLLLLAERERVDGARTLLGKPTPCVGRERELSLLLGLFDECAGEPAARAVVITAAPGVGKSRLGHEIARALEERGAEVWTGRGDPVGAGAPFGLIAPAIRGAAGISEGEAPGVKQRKLLARVGRHLAGAEQRRVAEFVGELSGVPFHDEESVELSEARRDARLMGDQMRRAWELFLAAECARGPLVLVLEDLHWGDVPSVEFVGAALSSLADRPLLVIALGRPEVRDRFPGLWEDRAPTEIKLADLSRRAAERLARAVLGEEAEAATVERVVAQACGNAFYLEELLRAVATGQGHRLPDTVLAMVEARLSRLDAEERRVLRAASVFGLVFTREGVSALLGDTPAPAGAPPLDEALARLVEHELVQRRAAEYVFRTSLVREAAYAMLTDADRTLGHGLAAAHLARGGEGDALVIGEHFERSGHPGAAIGWYARAALQALEASDLRGAVDRAERAIQCGATGEALGRLLLIQAEAHRWQAATTLAADTARAAMERLPRGSAPFWAAVAELSATLGKLGDAGALAALVEEVLAEPRRDDERPDDTAPLYRTVVELIHAGRYPLAGKLLERLGGVKSILGGRDASSAGGPTHGFGPGFGPAAMALVCQARAAWATCRGDVAGQRRETERSIEAAEAAGNLRLACLQRANLSDAYLQLGCYAEAERTAREALETATGMGLGDVAVLSRINLGIALASAGRPAEARATLAAAVAPEVEDDHPRAFVAAEIALADACALAGDGAEAERWARAAAAASASIAPLSALARATLARLLLGQGRAAEALVEARAAMELYGALGKIEWGEARVRLAWAEALSAAGETERAREAILAARAALAARAEAITEPALRESFLTRVRENAETMARADAWGRAPGRER